MDETKLTEREKDTLDFIMRYRHEYGYSPTWKEIAEGIYTESHTSVQRYLLALCEKGYITITPRTPRSIVINVTL